MAAHDNPFFCHDGLNNAWRNWQLSHFSADFLNHHVYHYILELQNKKCQIFSTLYLSDIYYNVNDFCCLVMSSETYRYSHKIK